MLSDPLYSSALINSIFSAYYQVFLSPWRASSCPAVTAGLNIHNILLSNNDTRGVSRGDVPVVGENAAVKRG